MKSQIEQKEQRTKLLVINSCFFYWKEQIMNNHHKIISLHVVSLPKLWEIFSKKKKPFRSNSDGYLGYT